MEDHKHKDKQIRNKALRKATIINLLEEHTKLRVTDLSDAINVSVVTIRSDLEELESEGLLKRVHGGAVINRNSKYSDDFEDRKRFKADEKKKIANAVVNLINDGDSLIINVGSTCAYICNELKKKKNLIVVTNALHIMNSLCDDNNNTLFFLGGHFDREMQITIGDDVCEQLMRYKVDKLIMGMDGVDIEAGATSYNHVEDAIMRQMIAQANERILVADDSKIGKVTFARIADLSDFNTLVTNYSPANEAILKEIEAIGIKVIVV